MFYNNILYIIISVSHIKYIPYLNKTLIQLVILLGFSIQFSKQSLVIGTKLKIRNVNQYSITK